MNVLVYIYIVHKCWLFDGHLQVHILQVNEKDSSFSFINATCINMDKVFSNPIFFFLGNTKDFLYGFIDKNSECGSNFNFIIGNPYLSFCLCEKW